jgi:hypothetical protein
MNKNGWGTFIVNTVFMHIVLSFSTFASYQSDLISRILFILGEIAVSYYLTGYALDMIKIEHLKHIENPQHWSHKPYQTYFVEEDLKLL